MAKETGLSMPLCITDLLFNTIGFMVLLVALSSFEEKAQLNEKVLQELNLSQHEDMPSTGISTASLYINILLDNNAPVIEVDGKRYSLQELEAYLKKLGGTAQVAIRCDENVLVGFNNSVLAACKRANLEKIDQIVKIGK